MNFTSASSFSFISIDTNQVFAPVPLVSLRPVALFHSCHFPLYFWINRWFVEYTDDSPLIICSLDYHNKIKLHHQLHRHVCQEIRLQLLMSCSSDTRFNYDPDDSLKGGCDIYIFSNMPHDSMVISFSV